MGWSLICLFFAFEFCYLECSEYRPYSCSYIKECNDYAECNAALDIRELKSQQRKTLSCDERSEHPGTPADGSPGATRPNNFNFLCIRSNITEAKFVDAE